MNSISQAPLLKKICESRLLLKDVQDGTGLAMYMANSPTQSTEEEVS